MRIYIDYSLLNIQEEDRGEIFLLSDIYLNNEQGDEVQIIGHSCESCHDSNYKYSARIKGCSIYLTEKGKPEETIYDDDEHGDFMIKDEVMLHKFLVGGGFKICNINGYSNFVCDVRIDEIQFNDENADDIIGDIIVEFSEIE